MKYRKKPVVIEAIKFNGSNYKELHKFMPQFTINEISGGSLENKYALIYTLEGTMRAKLGDWIIKGVKGKFYPCKPDIFEAIYEKVED